MNNVASNSPSKKILHILVALALAMGAFWLIWTMLLWYQLHPHLPLHDVFTALEPQRIAVPRLLMALDMKFFGGQSHVLYASAWLSIMACLGILFYTASDYFAQNTSSRVFYIGIAATLMFAPAHLWNLLNASNASWHLTFAFAFISFYVLVRGSRPPTIWAWLIAYMFAALAAFTTFTGVIVWLLLPVLAVRCTRAVLFTTVVISALLAAGYLNSVPLEAQAPVALGEASTEIIAKTLRALTWPLSAEKPLTGALLVSLSLWLLAFSGISFLVSEFSGRGPRYHPWVKISLAVSVLALIMAVATQFGWISEQASHPDGPNFERYNTVTAVYWIGIMGLALSTLNFLGSLHRLMLVGSCLTITTLLIYPQGDYLQLETKSVEYASSLYTSGENPELRRRVNHKVQRYPLKGSSPLCPAGSTTIHFENADIQGYKTIEVRLGALQSMITRDLMIYSERKLLARLHRSYTPIALARPTSNIFVGQLPSDQAHTGQLILVANSLGPNLFHCRMPHTISAG